jgi:tRNA U34 5-methylaminomethyl-2-thiouridine-forming methyltransferase MnmC
MQVYIHSGLRFFAGVKDPIRIFEMGFGTGLNALLSLIEHAAGGATINYRSIESDPLSQEEILKLNYCALLQRPSFQDFFVAMHAGAWNQDLLIRNDFTLHKIRGDILRTEIGKGDADLVYFDAFAPDAQPEIWSEAMFRRIYNLLVPGGILVTYCSKGTVRRALEKAGFSVEKLPGPPGKREITRALKPF